MTYVLVSHFYFSYFAILFILVTVLVNNYISEEYLFVVAHNVGFLKRFAGL